MLLLTGLNVIKISHRKLRQKKTDRNLFKVTVLENYIKIEATMFYNSFFNASNDKRTHCSVFCWLHEKNNRESLRNLNNKKCNFRVAVGGKKKKTSPKKKQQQQQQLKQQQKNTQIAVK